WDSTTRPARGRAIRSAGKTTTGARASSALSVIPTKEEAMSPIESDEQALTLALAIAIADPDETRAEQATANAIVLARDLDEVTVQACKRGALALVAEWRSGVAMPPTEVATSSEVAMPPELVGIAEIAELTGLSVATIHYHRKRTMPPPDFELNVGP